jgi:hypothetical protein
VKRMRRNRFAMDVDWKKVRSRKKDRTRKRKLNEVNRKKNRKCGFRG